MVDFAVEFGHGFTLQPNAIKSTQVFDFIANGYTAPTSPIFNFTSYVANPSVINVDLGNTCKFMASPINVDVCDFSPFYGVFTGSFADVDLSTSIPILITPEIFEFGQSIEIDVARFIIFDFNIEFGSTLENLNISLPPRALLDISNEFGAETQLNGVSTTSNLYINPQFGSGVESYLTPACITSIPLNIWRIGYWDVDCDSINRSQRYAKFYTFTLLSDKTVTIDLTSNEDSYLFLLDGHGFNGNLVALDDNSGVGTNSQIVIPLLAGDYTVESTTAQPEATGEFQLRVSIPTPDFVDVDIYHGQTLESLSLNAHPYFTVNHEFGSDVLVDLNVYPFAELEVNYEFGSTLNLATINFVQTFNSTCSFGSDVSVDLQINQFDKLEVNYEFGSDGNLDLATTDLFVADVYYGHDLEVDLNDNPFSELEVNYEFGSDVSISTISRSPTFDSYCFHGSQVSTELNVALSEGVGVCQAYYGDAFSLDEVGTEELTIFNQFGSSVDVDLETLKSFSFDNYDGSSVSVELLDNPFSKLEVNYEFGFDSIFDMSLTLGFLVEFEFGTDGYVELELPPRAHIEADAYFGSTVKSSETILELRPFAYNLGLDFHVQHNHCESCCDNVDQIYRDSTIRDGRIDMDFSTDNYKDDYPWSLCDLHEIKLSTEFQTNPRFVFDFLVDTPTVSAFLPREYLAFHEDVPVEILYQDTPRNIYRAEFEVEFQDTSGAWLWGDDWNDDTVYINHSAKLSVELTETKYVEMSSGSNVELGLETTVPEWKTEAFHDMIQSATLTVSLNGEQSVRFCPGYIIPTGNQMNFEFYGVAFTDCNVEWMYFGEELNVELEANYQVSVGYRDGAWLDVELEIVPPWELYIYQKHQLTVSLATEIKLGAETVAGQTMLVELEPLAWVAGHSTVECYCELETFGPNIGWITPSGCLVNEYIALDKFGDIDYLYYQPDPDKNFLDFEFEATIETKFFKHALEARCFKPEIEK